MKIDPIGSRLGSRLSKGLVGAAFVLAGLDLPAATHTWTGTASNLWSVPGNWMEGTTPMGDASAALVFPAGAMNPMTMNDLSGLTIQSITFSGAANNLSLDGQALTLMGGLTLDATVTSGFPTVRLPIQLGAAQTFTVAAQSAAISLQSNLSGASNSSLTLGGSGTFYTYGASAYAGGTVISPGTKVYGSGSMFLGDVSTGPLVQASGPSVGILGFYPSVSAGAEPLVFEDGSYFLGLNGGLSASSFAGPITLQGTVHMDVYGGETWTLAGVIGGVGGIDAGISDGTLVLTQSNTYSGPTTIHGQSIASPFKLRVDGAQPSSAVSVNNAGWLGGTGTVGPLTLNSGGKVSPGASPGILSVGGDANFNAGGTFAVELNGATAGTGYDRLSVSGNATLGGATLEVTLGYTPVMGTMFTILQAGGTVTGTFASLPNGATFCAGGWNLQITYSANAVTLTATGTESTPPMVTAPVAAATTQTICN
jgi:fibronectin-binding autotransporter adhesin